MFSLVLTAAFTNGLEVFQTLFKYVGVVVLALLIQQCVVYPCMLALLARRSPWKFFAESREVFVYAFSTSSSNATLPKSLETAETKLGTRNASRIRAHGGRDGEPERHRSSSRASPGSVSRTEFTTCT